MKKKSKPKEQRVECAFDSMVAIGDIKPNPRNPNLHPKKQIELLAKIIKAQGWRNPIVVSNLSGFVTKGHARLEAAKLLGLTEVPVDFQDYDTPESEMADMLADNRLAELAEPDLPLLKDILIEIDSGALDMDLTGYDAESIERLMTQLHQPEEGLTDDDAIPEQVETRCKKGDLWKLGEHRLLCGDSTVITDVERLMGGEKADMVFTSPPYNLGVSAKMSGNTAIGKRGNAYESYNDNQTEDDWLSLMTSFTSVWLSYTQYLFVNVQSLSGNRTALPRYWAEFKDQFCDVAIWNKEHAAPAAALRVMNSVFEFVLIFANENPNRSIRIAPEWRGNVSNIYTGSPQRHNESAKIHGATFPVHLPEYFVTTFSKIGVIIADPFLGSGSTLIACEKLGRKCYGMEIDPHYCDVILKRWEDFTGKTAELIKE